MKPQKQARFLYLFSLSTKISCIGFAITDHWWTSYQLGSFDLYELDDGVLCPHEQQYLLVIFFL
jgi:hypothetical protein